MIIHSGRYLERRTSSVEQIRNCGLQDLWKYVLFLKPLRHLFCHIDTVTKLNHFFYFKVMIRILFHKKGTRLLTQILKKKFRNFILVFSLILFYFCVCVCEAGVCVGNRPQPELSGFKYLSFTQNDSRRTNEKVFFKSVCYALFVVFGLTKN